jgi:hypothetical protein
MSTLLFAACISLGVVSAVPDVPAPATDSYHGKIAAISKASVALIDRQGENKTFMLTAETKITINGKPASWQDVGNGSMAKIKASGDLSAPVAMTIEVRSVEKVQPAE